MKVIAFDPGGTTGWCMIHSPHAIPTIEDTEWTFGQLGPEAHHLSLWNFCLQERPHFVIWERFMYQRRELDKGVSLVQVSLEYIGILKLFIDYADSLDWDVGEYEQTPAQAKNFWDDQKLKHLGLYHKSSPHIRDATRHMLYWLSFTKRATGWIQSLQGLSDVPRP